MKRMLLMLAVLPLMLGACASDSEESSPNSFEVKAKDFVFDPDVIGAEAGRMTFKIRNVGQEVHEFEIFSGKKLLDEVEDITPGLERSLTVTLKPGTYEFACKFEDHYERGMKGKLTVT